MKIALVALVVFVLGVLPGLAHYAGTPADGAGRPAQQTLAQAYNPLLSRLTESLKQRL